MRPPPSADPHGCVQNGRLPTFVTKPRNSLCRSRVQHRIPCLWYFQSAPLAKPETSCTIQVSRERHALDKTKKTGGNSSVGRVPDCDSGCRGFESHFPPQNISPHDVVVMRAFFICSPQKLLTEILISSSMAKTSSTVDSPLYRPFSRSPDDSSAQTSYRDRYQ